MSIIVTPLLKEAILNLAAKRAMLVKEAGNIETIVLGDSHGDYGFDPSVFPGAFNLCSRSQDFKYAELLYRHTARICPKLKNVVLFYSVFSPGNLIELSPGENDIAPALNEIFDLGVVYHDRKLKTLQESIQGKLGALTVSLEGTGGVLPRGFQVICTGRSRCE